MSLLNTFDPATTTHIINRLEKISHTAKPVWGKMNSAQMLAHLNIAYDYSYGKKKANLNFFSKLMMKLFVKGIVTSDKPYAKNSRTAPGFVIADERDFEKEKAIFIANAKDTELKGAAYFNGKANESFGVLTVNEWSNLFYKHIDHHFTQFGV